MSYATRNACTGFLVLALAAVFAGYAQPVIAVERDIAIILDNSGSMRSNDPHRLLHEATRTLIDTAGTDTRLAIIIFDDTVNLAVPLTRVTAQSRSRLHAALGELDYTGPWTHIPDAIERALYHLDREGRPGAAHDILFLTDGIIDTGDPARDQSGERWLYEELVPLAQERGVRIFGIAFSEESDFRLIQSLANRTGAEYLRVLDPENLPAAFESLYAALTRVPVPEPVPEPEEAPAEPEPRLEPVQPDAAPAQPAAVDAGVDPEPRRMTWPWFLAGLLLAGGFVYWFWQRRPVAAAPVADEDVPGAVLVDSKQVTGYPQFALHTAVSVIGRHPAPGPGIATSVLIDKGTVSRRHATIRWQNGQYWLEDHGSANGTYLNGEKVTGTVPLNDGDQLRIDTFDFEFREQQADATQVRGVDESERTQVRGHDTAEHEESERTSFDVTGFGKTEVGAELPDPVPAPVGAVNARFEYEGDVKFVDLQKPVLHIGRGGDNNLVVDTGRGISRHHATVERKEDGYYLSCISAQRVLLVFDGLERTLKENESVRLPETGEILLAGSREKASHAPIRFWIE